MRAKLHLIVKEQEAKERMNTMTYEDHNKIVEKLRALKDEDAIFRLNGRFASVAAAPLYFFLRVLRLFCGGQAGGREVPPDEDCQGGGVRDGDADDEAGAGAGRAGAHPREAPHRRGDDVQPLRGGERNKWRRVFRRAENK
eukprot:1176393-Prorocentrum_minimum.AAC.2